MRLLYVVRDHQNLPKGVQASTTSVSANVLSSHLWCLSLQVKLEMYVEYFRTIGLAFILPIVFLYAFQQAASLAYNYWLSKWADEPVVNGTQLNTDVKLSVYGALGFAQGEELWGNQSIESIEMHKMSFMNSDLKTSSHFHPSNSGYKI